VDGIQKAFIPTQALLILYLYSSSLRSATFLFRKRKVTKRNRPVKRPCGSPALLEEGGELWNSLALKQHSSPKLNYGPLPSAMLGALLSWTSRHLNF